MLAAWLHDWSPIIVKFTDTFALRWYGLSYALGFLIAWAWLRLMSRKGMTPLSVLRISDAMMVLVMGVVLGGRLGYVVFYDPALMTTFTKEFPFWGLLKVNNGGMSSHGGIIGVILASWVVSRGHRDEQGIVRDRVPWTHVLDLTAVACTPGLMLGRLANFINGELLGDIVRPPGTDGPWWAVRFPQERLTGDPLGTEEHAPALTPEQVDHLRDLIQQYRLGQESAAAGYRRVVEQLQTGSKATAHDIAEQLGPLLSSRYPSQLMQAATDGLILGGILWLIWWRPRRPGVIGAWFMLLYGVMRILTELVRLPDPQLAGMKAHSGLSMGQWLSVGMVAVGVTALVVLKKRPMVWPYNGWGRKAAAVASSTQDAA